MEFREITPQDRDIIEAIRLKNKHVLLSHSFYTLFLWQKTMQLSVYLEDDFFVVRYGRQGKEAYFFPCGNEDKAASFIRENISKPDFRLFYLREKDVDFMEREFGGSVSVYEARGSWEYIFNRKEHSELAGKKYAHIRNEENHLRANHTLASEPLSELNRADAYSVVSEWKERHGTHEDDDIQVAKCAIENFERIGMIGVVAYVDGEPQAIALGCEICADTYGIQVAKVAQKHKGLIFYVLHELFRVLPEQYEFLNGDDDLDIEGLRIHKEKMQPCAMNRVWEAGAGT